nr:uncharacterized protein CFP56_43985 [Quercus suber]
MVSHIHEVHYPQSSHLLNSTFLSFYACPCALSRQQKTDHASIQSIADSLFFSSSKMESFENIVEGIMALGRKPEFPDLMREKLCCSVDPVNVPVSDGPVKRCTTSWKRPIYKLLKVFRKTLMKSLQEDENSVGPPDVSNVQSHSSLSSALQIGALRPHISHGLLLASQTSTPRLTPPGSPPSLSALVSPI